MTVERNQNRTASSRRMEENEPLASQQLMITVGQAIAEAYRKTPVDRPTRVLLDLLGFDEGVLDPAAMEYPSVVEHLSNGSVTAEDGLYRWDENAQEFVYDHDIDAAAFWERLGSLVRSDLKGFSELVGVPELAGLAAALPWSDRVAAPEPNDPTDHNAG